MRSIQSSAKTMEEAVKQGLDKLGVSLGDVTIDIISEGSKGLFGLVGSKPVVVNMAVREDVDDGDILSSLSLQDTIAEYVKEEPHGKISEKEKTRADDPEKATAQAMEPATQQSPGKQKEGFGKKKAEPAAKKEKAEKRKPSQPLEQMVESNSQPSSWGLESPEGKVQGFIQNVTQMMGVDVSLEVNRSEEGAILVNMQGDTQGVLIGRRGETLDALQYLASLYLNRGADNYTRVTLDTENYRAKREEALKRLANRMASRAIKTGRKVVLEPMNPYERRILHSTLQQSSAVSTHSEGDEPNRHVVITLKQSV